MGRCTRRARSGCGPQARRDSQDGGLGDAGRATTPNGLTRYPAVRQVSQTSRAVLDVRSTRALDGAREEWGLRTTVSGARGCAARRQGSVPPASNGLHSKTRWRGEHRESVGRGTAVWGWRQVLASVAASTSCGGKPTRPSPVCASVSLLLGTHVQGFALKRGRDMARPVRWGTRRMVVRVATVRCGVTRSAWWVPRLSILARGPAKIGRGAQAHHKVGNLCGGCSREPGRQNTEQQGLESLH